MSQTPTPVTSHGTTNLSATTPAIVTTVAPTTAAGPSPTGNATTLAIASLTTTPTLGPATTATSTSTTLARSSLPLATTSVATSVVHTTVQANAATTVTTTHTLRLDLTVRYPLLATYVAVRAVRDAMVIDASRTLRVDASTVVVAAANVSNQDVQLTMFVVVAPGSRGSVEAAMSSAISQDAEARWLIDTRAVLQGLSGTPPQQQQVLLLSASAVVEVTSTASPQPPGASAFCSPWTSTSCIGVITAAVTLAAAAVGAIVWRRRRRRAVTLDEFLREPQGPVCFEAGRERRRQSRALEDGEDEAAQVEPQLYQELQALEAQIRDEAQDPSDVEAYFANEFDGLPAMEQPMPSTRHL